MKECILHQHTSTGRQSNIFSVSCHTKYTQHVHRSSIFVTHNLGATPIIVDNKNSAQIVQINADHSKNYKRHDGYKIYTRDLWVNQSNVLTIFTLKQLKMNTLPSKILSFSKYLPTFIAYMHISLNETWKGTSNNLK